MLPPERAPRCLARTTVRLLRGLLGLLLVGSFGSCKNYEDVEPEDVCEDVGFAISSRTFSCEKSSDRANARYHRFRDTVPCNVTKENMSFDCSVAIEALTCEQTAPYGDDFTQWLASEPCQKLFGPSTPAYQPPTGNCKQFRDAVVVKADECRLPEQPAVPVNVDLSRCNETVALEMLAPCLQELYAVLSCDTVARYAQGVESWTEAPTCQVTILGYKP